MIGLRRDSHGLGMTSQRARDRLIERLKSEGIRDPRVLDVMRQLPRHVFVDEGLETRAYEDSALPIGMGQTISQPYIVARMTELVLAATPAKVLEVGTGSGYQAAVLAQLGLKVFTVERIDNLLRNARRRFRALKLEHIRSKHDDGRLGWSEEGPFDAILLTAAGEHVPTELTQQLAVGGVLVAPVGPQNQTQRLVRITRTPDGLSEDQFEPVSFVPLLSGVT
ncbi:protein-L-isoaspartate O-methyltransferase [Ahniella affigens]|uniref:Protein-L-isoaspartate O-methyltransferase n=1 Tax=Ahniella affigens TaxID=2021234 RepID=A0A2P1PQ18_9GAMM|nr:protein-L-isoaspartate(D-aspartate) O-methyltransferase [Ahniella affigens]AVP96941.1 protein-L-isoaspartate O-methyltransferase [Ahniella affigens]